MTRKVAWALVALLALSGVSHAKERLRPVADDEAVRALHQAGQDERLHLQQLADAPADQVLREQEKVWKNDVLRRDQIIALLRQGEVVTAADHWRAAFVLQHGATLQDIQLAYSLATLATVLAPDEKRYRWLTAASWDRILTTKAQPQWYGTQFEPDPKTGLQMQARLADGAVSDEERTSLGVPTLAESVDMLRQINGAAP